MKILVQPPPGAPSGVPRLDEPVRTGVPMARGVCRDAGTLVLDGPAGPCPLQCRVLDRWPDGSIRWVLIDFPARHEGGPLPATYELRAGAGGERSPDRRLASIRDGAIHVDTGVARFVVGGAGERLFAAIAADGGPAIDAGSTGIAIADRDGAACSIVVETATVEEDGPVTAVVCILARARDRAGAPFVDLVARLHFAAGSATMRVALTVRNPRPARHPGGIWELGDPGSVHFRDLSFVLALAPAAASLVRLSVDPGSRAEPHDGAVELWQASSGGPQWNAPTHVTARGVVPLAFQGFRLRASGGARHGLRATPVALIDRGTTTAAMTMPHFWQNFPKALEAAADTLTLRLFPQQQADGHELQGGEQKTHVFYVACGSDRVTAVPLDWARMPLRAFTSPDEYARSGAVPYLQPEGDDPSAAYVALVRAGLEGPDAFAAKRERIDEYGWRHFGDLYADHEAVLHDGPGPFVSHYNNQYDSIAGFACQFMRSGDLRWWALCTELASHVADIDLYHTDGDKAAYNGGLFWHTFHYVPAGRSTHRAYPRAPGVGGGGPSPEHNYSGGLLLHYFMTGDPVSRDAVVDLARWVVAMDDGRRTPFRWLTTGDTGVASATATSDYHGPGRGPGNGINVLLDAYRLTADEAFVRKAEALIRRCIHPSDDIGARDLLDAERRWSYTVFLHALGRFLDGKVERRELDASYAYGRASLLAYADWMAAHERPYLDHPARLEYPTETWAAQELWKNEVFLFAAKHASGAARERYLDRASFFHDYAVRTLGGMRTRALARPLALLMAHGYAHGYALRHPDALRAPEPPVTDFGRPCVFVPQKAIVVRRFGQLLIAVAAAAVVTAWWFLT